MSEEKVNSVDENKNEAPVNNDSGAEKEASLNLEEFLNKIKSLSLENEELKKKIMLKEADLINYRKRKDEEVTNLLKFASQDIILDIIKIKDNFERALKSINDNEENQNVLVGVKMIYSEIVKLLENNDVKEISESGILFDSSIHNAVMTDSINEVDDDIVLEILTKGYIYKGRVIRPAMVKVNKK